MIKDGLEAVIEARDMAVYALSTDPGVVKFDLDLHKPTLPFNTQPCDWQPVAVVVGRRQMRTGEGGDLQASADGMRWLSAQRVLWGDLSGVEVRLFGGEADPAD